MKSKQIVALLLAAALTSTTVFAQSAPDEGPLENAVQNLPAKISQNPRLALQDHVVTISQNWFMSSVQSFVTALVLVGIGDVHREAHERNLQLTPENVKKLSAEVSGRWDSLKQSAYSASDGALMFLPSQGLNFVAAKTVERVVASQALSNVLKTLIASSVLSIGLNYVTGLINFSAQYVLAHPSEFGGLNETQTAVIKILQVRSGISYYFHGLVAGGPNTKAAHLKVLKAMQLILLHDPILRETLWSHLTREALLKGNNITIVGMSVLSTLIQNALLPAEKKEAMGWFEKSYKSFGISLAIAVTSAELIPSWFEDLETYAMRDAYAGLKKDQEYIPPVGLREEFQKFSSQAQASSWIANYLAQRRSTREYRAVMFLSLMNLDLDRIDKLVFEEQQIRKLSAQNSGLGLKNSFYSILGGDLLSAHMKLDEDEHLLAFYEKLYWSAAANVTAIYTQAADEMDSDVRAAPPGDQKPFSLEAANMRFMEAFTEYFGRTLSENWPTSRPGTGYLNAREALEQISFWGFHETDVIPRGAKLMNP